MSQTLKAAVVMNKEKRSKIFEILKRHNPKPTTELKYQSDFELLISVILSAQATDVSVNKATEKLYPIANTPEKISALGEEKLKLHIKTIGLYNSKAINIIKTCKILISTGIDHVSEIVVNSLGGNANCQLLIIAS